MFYLIPFLLGSVIGIFALILSLIFKRLGKLTSANIVTYIGILIGGGILWYSLEIVRGFEGAMIGLIGVFAILECIAIRIYLASTKKEVAALQSKQSMGLLSFISLIVGLISLGVYIFTGDSFIDDNITMLLGFTFLVLSFILSLFSKKDKLGRVSLYVSPILMVIYLLFFGVMSLFWNTP
ncbi:MAG: hypothetical protein ABS942_05410 [Solibacillus sp.]|uniref:hypothetical protein n=1 Tax=Solibacillus sp. TaxID=1909654 RepID=UPI003316213D